MHELRHIREIGSHFDADGNGYRLLQCLDDVVESPLHIVGREGGLVRQDGHVELQGIAARLLEFLRVGQPVLMAVAVHAADDGYGQALFGFTDKREMPLQRIVSHMLGNVFVTGAVVVHGGHDVGVALDVVYNLFLKHRLHHHGTGAGRLEFAKVVNTGCQTTAACNDGTLQIQSQVFRISCHRYSLFVGYKVCSKLQK